MKTLNKLFAKNINTRFVWQNDSAGNQENETGNDKFEDVLKKIETIENSNDSKDQLSEVLTTQIIGEIEKVLKDNTITEKEVLEFLWKAVGKVDDSLVETENISKENFYMRQIANMLNLDLSKLDEEFQPNTEDETDTANIDNSDYLEEEKGTQELGNLIESANLPENVETELKTIIDEIAKVAEIKAEIDLRTMSEEEETIYKNIQLLQKELMKTYTKDIKNLIGEFKAGKMKIDKEKDVLIEITKISDVLKIIENSEDLYSENVKNELLKKMKEKDETFDLDQAKAAYHRENNDYIPPETDEEKLLNYIPNIREKLTGGMGKEQLENEVYKEALEQITEIVAHNAPILAKMKGTGLKSFYQSFGMTFQNGQDPGFSLDFFKKLKSAKKLKPLTGNGNVFLDSLFEGNDQLEYEIFKNIYEGHNWKKAGMEVKGEDDKTTTKHLTDILKDKIGEKLAGPDIETLKAKYPVLDWQTQEGAKAITSFLDGAYAEGAGEKSVLAYRTFLQTNGKMNFGEWLNTSSGKPYNNSASKMGRGLNKFLRMLGPLFELFGMKGTFGKAGEIVDEVREIADGKKEEVEVVDNSEEIKAEFKALTNDEKVQNWFEDKYKNAGKEDIWEKEDGLTFMQKGQIWTKAQAREDFKGKEIINSGILGGCDFVNFDNPNAETSSPEKFAELFEDFAVKDDGKKGNLQKFLEMGKKKADLNLEDFELIKGYIKTIEKDNKKWEIDTVETNTEDTITWGNAKGKLEAKAEGIKEKNEEAAEKEIEDKIKSRELEGDEITEYNKIKKDLKEKEFDKSRFWEFWNELEGTADDKLEAETAIKFAIKYKYTVIIKENDNYFSKFFGNEKMITIKEGEESIVNEKGIGNYADITEILEKHCSKLAKAAEEADEEVPETQE